MKSNYAIDTPLGAVHIEEEGGKAVRLLLPGTPPPPAQGSPQTALAAELNEYLAGKRKVFRVPIEANGPPFHRSVWEALMAIPYGSTVTYAELAALAGRPGAARAAGRALAANPLPLLIPCHRVVYAHGKRQSYQGGEAMKAFLLELEKRNS